MLCLKDILSTFEKASGLIINLHKSAIVFSRNVEEDHQRELAGVFGVTLQVKHEKYLGLLTGGRSKRELFEGLKDHVWHKFHCWSAKTLSQAGRAVLVKNGYANNPDVCYELLLLDGFVSQRVRKQDGRFFSGMEVRPRRFIGEHGLNCVNQSLKVELVFAG
ncbi:UNVERIFIED_CONTAM: hypothetical protein Slati_4262100 [Sesamum latifolium]|uniref:Uncharacterized protein n=1 Tax=Sesamum latifolium TaxID=2727402 RepID=A0AAW2TDH6_9LAMI